MSYRQASIIPATEASRSRLTVMPDARSLITHKIGEPDNGTTASGAAWKDQPQCIAPRTVGTPDWNYRNLAQLVMTAVSLEGRLVCAVPERISYLLSLPVGNALWRRLIGDRIGTIVLHGAYNHHHQASAQYTLMMNTFGATLHIITLDYINSMLADDRYQRAWAYMLQYLIDSDQAVNVRQLHAALDSGLACKAGEIVLVEKRPTARFSLIVTGYNTAPVAAAAD